MNAVLSVHKIKMNFNKKQHFETSHLLFVWAGVLNSVTEVVSASGELTAHYQSSVISSPDQR